jgi:hypothetical protein
MINTEITYLPAYTTRDFRNFGLHKANSLYKFMFTIQDIALLNSGAIKVFPTSMFNYISKRDVNLNGIKYFAGDKVDTKDFDEKTLFTLIKGTILISELKDEFKELDDTKLVEVARLYEYVGKTFKTATENLGLDSAKVKEAFELKQGGVNKKIKAEDINKLQELVLEV